MDLSNDDLRALKQGQRLQATGGDGAAVAARWRVITMGSAQAAANFVNIEPAQAGGEAAFSNRLDGQVDVYYYL